MSLVIILVVGGCEVLIFEHPFGYIASIVVAVLLVSLMIIVMRRVVKKRFHSSVEYQKAFDELGDQILKSSDDPNEPARFVP